MVIIAYKSKDKDMKLKKQYCCILVFEEILTRGKSFFFGCYRAVRNWVTRNVKCPRHPWVSGTFSQRTKVSHT